MDLLVEKLDGSRYYLSQYKVLITEFEESAPSVTRNSKQLDQRNGNIDFGGWHTDKTIDITGYYRADDMDEEEALREKLYALLSDPDGYYITQLKTSPEAAVERPGETSGNYYDKLKDYPSHKRFLVYTEAPEMELVGNVNGTLLYKLTAEFKTMKLPYGETPKTDINANIPSKEIPDNLLHNTGDHWNPVIWSADGTTTTQDGITTATNTSKSVIQTVVDPNDSSWLASGVTVTISVDVKGQGSIGFGYFTGSGWEDDSPNQKVNSDEYIRMHFTRVIKSVHFDAGNPNFAVDAFCPTSTLTFRHVKANMGPVAYPWSPNTSDHEYADWYYKESSISYRGTVPCSQLEQGFTVQLTATGSASSLSFKIDDTELTSSNAVATGDVFLLNGFSYTQNGLSIVSKTNKAYFVLQPDKPNRITCNVPGKVRILGFQNLYA
ncbi:phage tail domain-containing protein [Lacticaseibacillus paracasei]|uniref:phage tail domain-containing protein n=1 Tax=Lacticaseibacillus paracasei TaxID=1597 RepID=UPI002F262256